MGFLENIANITAEINGLKEFKPENVVKICNRYLETTIYNLTN